MSPAAASTPAVDFPSLIGPVARRLLGEPNKALSSPRTLRWGNHGSLKVDLDPGCFHDKEANTGGGTLDLIMRERRCDKRGAIEWLEREGLKDPQPALMATASRSASQTFYDYADEHGTVLFRVERRGKDAVPPFLQHGPDDKGGFHAARGCMQGVRRVPYRLPELLAASPDAIVFVCEGEKDVDNLRARGFVATTNPGGAGKFTAEQAQSLAGRMVVALQDNDDAGANHVASVISALKGVAAKAVPLLLPNLPAKGDVSDFLKVWGADAAMELERVATDALRVPAAPVETFPIADLAAWAAATPEPKKFIMAGFIPEHEVTLFTGAGGTNKSTFGLQLAACSAAALPLLGVPVQPAPALYVTAEDDDRENHWRLRKIGDAIGVPLERLAGRLHVVSLRGRLSNELATFDHEGRLQPAPAYKLLRATIEATGSKLLVLDNVGHLFVGNENDRGQVTGFINLLYQLCRELGVTIVLIAHPNKEFLKGNKQGNATSGSTAWLNAVRSQILIQRPEGNPDPDARLLTLGKANYARPDQQLAFRWHDFALVRDEDLSDDRRAELALIVRSNAENTAFMDCLAARAEQGEGRQVGPNSGPNYAPTQFEGMAQAKGIKRDRLKVAMDRLFAINAIETHTYRNTGKGRDVTIIRAVSTNPELAPRTHPEHVPQTPPNSTPEHTPPHTLPLRGDAGAAYQAPAPGPDHAEKRPNRGMILAPGETGDEPIPGMEDL